MTPSLLRLQLLVLLTLASLTACTVGPDYQGAPDAAPVAAKANAFHRAATADAIAADPPARWWEALQDPLLTRLIETALRRSPTVQQDEARLRNPRATVSEQPAGCVPQRRAQGPGGTHAASDQQYVFAYLRRQRQQHVVGRRWRDEYHDQLV